MKIKNLNIRKKAVAMALAGTLTSCTLLTGCGNHQFFDTKYTYNKAIIVNGNCASIIEIDKWNDYEGEQLQIVTKDGLVILTSAFDTKLINDETSELSAEEVARGLVGEDGEITYTLPKGRTRTR